MASPLSNAFLGYFNDKESILSEYFKEAFRLRYKKNQVYFLAP